MLRCRPNEEKHSEYLILFVYYQLIKSLFIILKGEFNEMRCVYEPIPNSKLKGQ